MERDIVSKDYSAFVDLPTVGAKVEKGAFNDLQMAKLEQLAADGMPWADTALMLCYTGFRVSEFLGLTRFAYHTDGDYLQGGMKTAAGRGRIVPVHPKIKPYLSLGLPAVVIPSYAKPMAALSVPRHTGIILRRSPPLLAFPMPLRIGAATQQPPGCGWPEWMSWRLSASSAMRTKILQITIPMWMWTICAGKYSRCLSHLSLNSTKLVQIVNYKKVTFLFLFFYIFIFNALYLF